jgi:hypothetical protein
VAPPSVRLQTAHPDIQPQSVVINWNDGSARTATDNGRGLLSGDATGRVYYESGVIDLVPDLLSAGGQQYSVSYSTVDEAAKQSDNFGNLSRNGDSTLTLPLTVGGVTPGTVKMVWTMDLTPETVSINSAGSAAYRVSGPSTLTGFDDGAGVIKNAIGGSVGTINYTTGDIQYQPDASLMCNVLEYHFTPVAAFTLS